DDSRGDGIGAGCHDDGNVTGALLSGRQRLEWPGNDHIHARALELCRLLWHQFTLAARIPWLHHESLPFHVAKLTHSLTECVHVQIIGGRIPTRHPADSGNFGRCLCIDDKWRQHGPQSHHEENSDLSWFHGGLPFSVYRRRRTRRFRGKPAATCPLKADVRGP